MSQEQQEQEPLQTTDLGNLANMAARQGISLEGIIEPSDLQQQQPPAEAPQETPAPAEEQTPAETPQETPAPAEAPPANQETIFFQNDKPPVNIENQEQFMSEMEDKYAIKDLNTLNNSIGIWRGDSQKLVDAEKQITNLNTIFESMPEPLFAAVSAWDRGQDWGVAYENAGARVDYTQAFENHPKEQLVTASFPDWKNVADGEINRMEDPSENDKKAVYDRVLDTYVNATRTSYNQKKNDLESKRATLVEKQQEYDRIYKQSQASSVEKLKQKFTGFAESEIRTINSKLSSGALMPEVQKMFFNKDGSLQDDAAIKFALLKHGEREIEHLVAQAKKSGITEANADILNRGQTEKDKTGAQNQAQSTGASRELESMLKLAPVDVYANAFQGE